MRSEMLAASETKPDESPKYNFLAFIHVKINKFLIVLYV